MDSKSSYSLTEIRDAMRARVPQGVGMGRENVFSLQGGESPWRIIVTS